LILAVEWELASAFVCFPQRRHGGAMKTWMCLICGWIYDEAAGVPEEGVAPGTRWEDIPPNWTCPECGARKEDFEMVEI
jgi:rubredoxin